MEATRRVRLDTRYEWVLPAKAHSTEVEKAIAAARTAMGDDADVWMEGDGTELIVYTVVEETPRPPLTPQKPVV
jgi:hypothetical protein